MDGVDEGGKRLLECCEEPGVEVGGKRLLEGCDEPGVDVVEGGKL